MRAFLRIVFSRWVTTIFGAVLCGAMIWFYGPLLPFLRGTLPLGIALVVLACVTIAANLAIDHVRRRADQALAGGVTKAAGPDAATAEANARLAEQRDKLARAMALLRKARGTRGYLYEQPWYVIIGPPGAGKSTTLENSGLKFPLAADLGQAKLSGVGGTRLCDWWFADEATLIDTAGRYTTQDSDAAADRTEWLGFLDLLKRTRPRQPLNGIIVAIAMNEIVSESPAVRLAHARAIRSRIKEINEHLHARIPVYALFTKADLILGFTEFFDDLDREGRAQVWGTTFPPDAAATGTVGRFADEFRALVASLSARVLDRLQAERSLERRALIAAFPTQVASMEAPLGKFLQEAFSGTRLDPAPALRGVYMVSATQEGNPIDRLIGALARSFGLDQRRVESLRPRQGRSYFIERLLKQVIFNEAMLGLRNPAAARRRVALRAGAWGLSAAVAFGGVLALWLASGRSAAQVAVFDTALADYTKAAGAARLDPVPLAGADLLRVKPLLDQARALTQGGAAMGGDGPIMLSQAVKLGKVADFTYRRALERILLPRLVSLLEARMREYSTDIDNLYGATRIYVMLTDTRYLDPAAVHAWMDEDWSQRSYPGPTLMPVRTALLQHLDALLSQPWTETVAADPQLLGQSRAVLAGTITVPARIYVVLRSSAAAQSLAPWVPADKIGPLAERRFVRRSGRPLSDPIPGLYTAEGFQTVILPNLRKATEQVARQEGWVLGGATQFDMDNVAAVGRNEAAVIDLYARDYAAHWDQMLGDLDIVPPADAAAATTDFKVLASPQSPIRSFLAEVVQQLVLTEPGSPPPAGAAAPRPAAGAPPPVVPASSWFDGHYRALRDFVGPGAQAQLDNVLGLLDQLQQQIAAQVVANASGNALPVPPGGDAARAVENAASWSPEPVGRWLHTLAGRGGAVRSDAERRQAALAFTSGGGTPQALCQQVTARYPFRAGVRDDVSLQDFSDLFAPNGRLDAFFTQYIRPYVDTTQKPWRVHDVAGVQAPVTPDAVGQFQRAADIRDTFFPGGALPRIQFALRPLSLDAGARQVTLDFGGVAQTYAQGAPSHALPFDWPGATRMTDVQVVFDPPSDGGARLQQTGPWALFRLFAQGRLQRVAGSEKFNLTFAEGERQASFELTAATLHNPFAGDLFAGFHCPAMRP